MSAINMPRTERKFPNHDELLISPNSYNKDEIKHEIEHLQYEKLKHNLKKKIKENIMDKFAEIVQNNEKKNDIHILASLITKSDAQGLYQRLKKINKRKNEPHNVKACFINWLYKTPKALEQRKKSKRRNNKIINYFYNYSRKEIPNVASKIVDMTTKKKLSLTNQTKEDKTKPKYKYNYSSNNTNVFYNKSEKKNIDPNKGNIYIRKRNGDANYYHKLKYNNFSSLTIIEHNINHNKTRNYLRTVRDTETSTAYRSHLTNRTLNH